MAAVFLMGAMQGYAGEAKNSPQERPYVFGAFPHLEILQMEQVFTPMALELSNVLRRRVIFHTRSTFAQFTQDLAAKRYDFALIQPFDYPAAHDKWGYVPLVHREEPITGSIMVRADSPLRSLKDLAGHKLGLPPEGSAVSYMTKLALDEAGLNISRGVHVIYYKTHESCLQQLVIRNIEACGSEGHLIRLFEKKWSVHFRVLGTTPPIPGAVLVAQSRIPNAEREALIKAILEWPDNENVRGFLQLGGLGIPVRARDDEFNVVRRDLKLLKAN